jgi:flagellar biosynthesis protein FlhA
VQKIYGDEEVLPVVTLDPELEQLLQQSMLSARQNGETDVDAIIEPGLAQKLQESIRQVAQQQEIGGKPAVLLVSGVIRALLSKFARYAHSSVHVLAFNEIPPTKQLTIEATLA